jgi:hypothetical protein
MEHNVIAFVSKPTYLQCPECESYNFCVYTDSDGDLIFGLECAECEIPIECYPNITEEEPPSMMRRYLTKMTTWFGGLRNENK